MTVVTCDAGLDGGVAVFEDGEFVRSIRTPKHKKRLDMKELNSFFRDVSRDICRDKSLFVIESQFVPKGQGQGHSKPIFTNFGLIKGLAYAYFGDVIEIDSKIWKKALRLKGGKAHKKDSVDMANKLFNLAIPYPNDGEAEAVLIGHYFNILKGEY